MIRSFFLRWCSAAGLLAFTVALLTGCPPPEPVCGNGVEEEGEDEQNCCEDTGCVLGVCGSSGACESPWTSACEAAGAGTCLENSSAVCADEAKGVPLSDCTQCGCRAGDRCEDQVCVDVATRDAERTGPLPPNDLETPDFFALIQAANTLESTFGEAVSAARSASREDPRAALHVVGRIGHTEAVASDDRVLENSGLEAEVVAAYLNAVVALSTDSEVMIASGYGPTPWEGTTGPVTSVSPSLEACETVQVRARAALDAQSSGVLVADAAVAHRESCTSPALFPTCTHPHLDGCLERAGALPQSVFVMSTALILDRLERAFLIRIGNQQAFAIDGRLEQTITQWLDLTSNLARPARYRVDLDSGATAYVRGRPMQSRAGYTLLVIEDREPWGLTAFRLLWNDAPSQTFFIDEDVTAADCSYFRRGDLVTFDCEDGGARLFAEIDMTTRTIVTNERTPRP